MLSRKDYNNLVGIYTLIGGSTVQSQNSYLFDKAGVSCSQITQY